MVTCELCGQQTTTENRLVAVIPQQWLHYSNIRDRIFRCDHCDEVTIAACPF